MAKHKNKSGMSIYVHVGNGQTVVVAPGDAFPDEAKDIDPALYGGKADDGDDGGTGGDGGTTADYRKVTVPHLQAALKAAEVEFDGSDRKDALVEKATAAGLTPERVAALAGDGA